MADSTRADTGNSDSLGESFARVTRDSAGSNGNGAQPDAGVMSRTQARSIIERSVSNLGSLAGKLNLILAQAELDSAPLQRLGFRSVKTVANFESASQNVDAELIISLGMDGSATQRILHGLNGFENTPTVLVVMIIPFDDEGGEASPQRYIQTSNRLARVRSHLFDSGADDVMCLFGDEVLMPHRVMESVQKSEYMANKMRDIIDAEVCAVEEKAARKLQQAHRRFLMMLPGRVLENIPYEDDQLREWRAENGSLVGVGDCKFTAKLGSGAFGHVFKSEIPTHGPVAIKIISKRSVKNANILFSVDRELCHMMYSEPHPNIVRALKVMHGMHNFYIVLEYAGPWHLQRFVKQTLERSGAPTLPIEKIRAFSIQQASAVSHLHGVLVCHRDIKPDNWIVSDDGSTLRLADFGLTMQLSGPHHPLRQSCGSLPFCAPEVFNSEDGDEEGYDALAADVWSLGVNYMELVSGLYSIEKLLGWLPQHPNEHGTIVTGLQSLAEKWTGIADEDKSGLSNTILNMVVLRPPKRWKIGQVLGTLNTGTGRRHLRNLCSPTGGVADEVNSSSSGRHPSQGSREPPGGDRAGGGSENVRLAVNRMLDNFLWEVGFGDIFNSNPRQFSVLRGIFLEYSSKILDVDPESAQFAAMRAKVRQGHEGLLMSDSHFTMLMQHFQAALRHYDVDDRAIEEKLALLRPEAAASCRALLSEAVNRNTPDWRSQVLNDLQSQQISGFAETFHRRILESPVLNQTSLQNRNAGELEADLLRYLTSGVEAAQGPILLPDGDLCKVAHLVLVNLARDAFLAAGWSEDVAQVLHLTMLQQWEHAH